MNLLKRIFGNNKPQQACPRCLGKGHVDEQDIVRLNMQLLWRPGNCAYCNGTGKVAQGTENEVPVDTAYLTTDIGPDERKRILRGDAAAWERADNHDIQLEYFIDQVCYLHFDTGLTAGQVARFYMLNHPNTVTYESEEQELLEYISKIIAERKGQYGGE